MIWTISVLSKQLDRRPQTDFNTPYTIQNTSADPLCSILLESLHVDELIRKLVAEHRHLAHHRLQGPSLIVLVFGVDKERKIASHKSATPQTEP
jgi:hypothetical protein